MKKRETCFITLLQMELKSNVERLATHETCLATNHVVAGCETLLQKVESSSTCLTKMTEYSPRLFCSVLFLRYLKNLVSISGYLDLTLRQ